jgi:hypothetical protein
VWTNHSCSSDESSNSAVLIPGLQRPSWDLNCA